ncbi:MAG: AtpZ/AtpI family protein [Litorimonas sp.]
MPEQNGQSDPSSPTDLDSLETKLADARARRDARTGRKEKTEDNSLLGMAWRLSTELLASVMVGMFLGWGIDTIFGSRPWGFLIGLGFGIAAGFMSVFRTAEAMDAKTAHIPKGDDLPDDDDLD